ncbi:MAG: T9SS type A sorting domain-containing protein [Ignavibacteria bacterium]|nr:T9SS type A sorting domain-containing protein [Ignavibacteria bacterium]
MKTFSLKYPLLFVLAIFLFVNISFSQTNNWQRAYRPNGDIYMKGMCQSNNGDFFLLLESYTALIYKINSNGDSIFATTISTRIGHTCISSDDGGMIFTGNGGNKPYSTRINSQGLIYWDNTYYSGYNGADYFDIIKTQNSYISAGEGALKFNLIGDFIWQKFYPTSYTKIYWSVIEAIDEGYIMAGEICDGMHAPTYGVITKIDTAGNLKWEKRYTLGDPNNNFLRMKAVKRNNTYYAGGHCPDPPLTGNAKIAIFKLDLNGNVRDTLRFNGDPDFNYFFWDMKFISDNRIVVLYNRHKYYDSTIAAAMIIDTSGHVIRSREYTGTDYTKLQKIYLHNSNTIFFTGISDHYSIWFDNPFVVKTDTTLYAPPVSVRNISQTVPDNFYMKQNYPNPFNSATQIVFGIKKKGLYNLKIYDVTGKLISEIFNQNFEPGEYKTDFHADNLSSGVYFYKLESNNSIITKKFVLLK